MLELLEQAAGRSEFWFATILLIGTICVITYSICFKQSKYPLVLRWGFRHLFIYALLPWELIFWLITLEGPYQDMLLIVLLYHSGILMILLRRYSIVFMREMPQVDPNFNPRDYYRIKDLAESTVFYYLILGYWFVSGTFFLYLILERRVYVPALFG